MRKLWKSQETVLRQSIDWHEKVYYSTSVVIPYTHVCSCLFARCPHADLRVATRPWLAFQAKGHGKNLVLINSVLINSVLIISVLINSVFYKLSSLKLSYYKPSSHKLSSYKLHFYRLSSHKPSSYILSSYKLSS